VSLVVIGAGQAGLAVSRGLRRAGLEHLVLEAEEVAAAWRRRWDSFTLVTPNWTLDLPGHPYAGDAPEGHVPRDEIVARLGAEAPTLPDPPPFLANPPAEANLDDFGAVILTSGYRPDYTGWRELPVFDDLGFPIVDDELATTEAGLYFCGVHFLRTRRSSLLFGVGDDAALVVASILRAAEGGPAASRA
jgi:thioredoxin reductase